MPIKTPQNDSKLFFNADVRGAKSPRMTRPPLPPVFKRPALISACEHYHAVTDAHSNRKLRDEVNLLKTNAEIMIDQKAVTACQSKDTI